MSEHGMNDSTQREGLERLRLDMISARVSLHASTRRMMASWRTDEGQDVGLVAADLAAHRELCHTDETATLVYVECLLKLSLRVQERAERVSRPSPLL